MSSLPDIQRPRLSPPVRALASQIAKVAAAAAWHTLHPNVRERFVEADKPPPAQRLYYTTDDGWRCPILHLGPAPGGAGEPVLLAHTLGVGVEGYRYGEGHTLASTLVRAGFSVYLLTHRGDRDAIAPPDAAGFDVDTLLEQDVPAALERIRAHSGFSRVHWIGHGLGGQLGLAWAARVGTHDLASLVAIGAPVLFDAPRSEARRAALVAHLLPTEWHMPTRAIGPLVAPWVGGGDGSGRLRSEASRGERLRGVLSHATEDLPVGVLRQMSRWLRTGTLCDRTGLVDYVVALSQGRVPLLVAYSANDPICPERAARPAVESWAHADASVLELPECWSHLDPMVGADAEDALYGPVASWLDVRRRLAWGR